MKLEGGRGGGGEDEEEAEQSDKEQRLGLFVGLLGVTGVWKGEGRGGKGEEEEGKRS